jgi:hypothetical protein
VNEYQMCVDKRGPSDKVCLQRGWDYLNVCPEKWVDNFKTTAEAGAPITVSSNFVK